MSKTLLEQATENLRKAIPLMIKHRMPAIPSNYALWYTYVANESPALTEELNQVLEAHKVCPPATAKKLYRTHVADKREMETWQLRQNLEAMMIELAQSMNDTQSGTTGFQETLDKCFSDLNRVEDEGWSMDEVMRLVRKLVTESKAIHNSTRYLNTTLESAQQEITALRAQLEASQQDALYDSLTGLLNRRSFDTELTGLIDGSNKGLCLILADIDHFKAFNDKHGHLVGDQILKAVGKRLAQSCRDGQQAFRFGGEEFVLLVPNSSLRRARQLADAIRRGIERLHVKDKRTGRQIDNITASFGVSEFTPGDTLATFVERADKHLFDAKRLGRNRVLPI